MKYFIPAVMLCFALQVSSVHADTYQVLDMACSQYANSAVAHQNENLGQGCGFTGPRWNDGFDYHYRWCIRGENRRYMDRETQARMGRLGRCVRCVNYARRAVAQQNESLNLNCGFRGPRWSAEFEYHRNWCMRGENEQHNAGETKARNDELGRCGWCGNYARNAVAQQNENLSRGCGFRGPRWSTDFDYHRNWCMHGENFRYNDREFRARADALATCK